MKCERCGTEAPAGATVCPGCGAPLRAPLPAPPPAEPDAMAEGAAVPAGVTPADGDGAAPAVPRRELWARRLRRGGVVVVVLGLLGVGAVGGWWLRDRSARRPPPDVRINVEAGAAGATSSTVNPEGMPSLVGLTEDEALEALAAVGIGPGQVESAEQPAAGQPGIVVGQEPTPGRKLTGTVKLRISAPATMPDLAGKSETDARQLLGDLGAQVVVTEAFDPARPEGTVLATDPAAGAPLTDRVTLTVAQAPTSVFLSALDAVDNDCSTGQATVNGTPYPEAFTCNVNPTRPAVLEYVSNRRASLIQATIGLSDRGEPAFPGLYRVFVDGTLAAEQTVPFGQAAELSVPVAGALRVRIEVYAVGDPNTCCGSGARAVLGNARFVGAPDAIAALIAESGG